MGKNYCFFKRLQKGYKTFLWNVHNFNIVFMFDIYEKNRYNSINLEKETGFRCMRLRNYYSAVTFMFFL